MCQAKIPLFYTVLFGLELHTLFSGFAIDFVLQRMIWEPWGPDCSIILPVPTPPFVLPTRLSWCIYWREDSRALCSCYSLYIIFIIYILTEVSNQGKAFLRACVKLFWFNEQFSSKVQETVLQPGKSLVILSWLGFFAHNRVVSEKCHQCPAAPGAYTASRSSQCPVASFRNAERNFFFCTE